MWIHFFSWIPTIMDCRFFICWYLISLICQTLETISYSVLSTKTIKKTWAYCSPFPTSILLFYNQRWTRSPSYLNTINTIWHLNKEYKIRLVLPKGYIKCIIVVLTVIDPRTCVILTLLVTTEQSPCNIDQNQLRILL